MPPCPRTEYFNRPIYCFYKFKEFKFRFNINVLQDALTDNGINS